MTVSLLSAKRAIVCDSVDEDGLLAPGPTARDYAALDLGPDGRTAWNASKQTC